MILKDVLDGVAQVMEDEVPDLTTALAREADPTDNEVRWPHGEITVVSNIRNDPWNTDVVDYATDNSGNRIGYILKGQFEVELQLNIWIAVPSSNYDIQTLGGQLETGLRKYDENRKNPAPLPDGQGGSLSNVGLFRITGGGELPTANENSPLRGYAVSVELTFSDTIDSSQEYGSEPYIDSLDIPESGDLTDTDPTDEIEIDFNAS